MVGRFSLEFALVLSLIAFSEFYCSRFIMLASYVHNQSKFNSAKFMRMY